MNGNIATIEFTGTTCRCGCGTVIGKKSRFAQGHDARFVSTLKTIAVESDKGLHADVRLVDKSTDPASQSMTSVKDAIETLGSTALMEKLINGFKKEAARAEDRKVRETKRALAKENAKQRRTSAKRADEALDAIQPTRDAADAAAKTLEMEARAEAGTQATQAIDLDTLGAGDPVTDEAPEATVEGEKPVARKNGGRTKRGNLGSQG